MRDTSGFVRQAEISRPVGPRGLQDLDYRMRGEPEQAGVCALRGAGEGTMPEGPCRAGISGVAGVIGSWGGAAWLWRGRHAMPWRLLRCSPVGPGDQLPGRSA